MASKEQISVFDILKIGIGPSSSHTLGPWRAVQMFMSELEKEASLSDVISLEVSLYGSLAKTGKGHGTDKAIMLSLLGEEPETVDTESIDQKIQKIISDNSLSLKGKHVITFGPRSSIIFKKNEVLPFHPNGMTLAAHSVHGRIFEETYFSVGGGFVVKEGESLNAKDEVRLPFPCSRPQDLHDQCVAEELSIAELVWANEKTWRAPETINSGLLRIWHEMKSCVFRGCHSPGELPGGLHTIRRAPRLYQHLMGNVSHQNPDDLMKNLIKKDYSFQEVLKWVSCFAIAVNEENAAFGRVVTAPTNGAAGVIPAVLLYYLCFCRKSVDEKSVIRFLLICGEIGSFYKKGATISAAMGGCQAEIGVSSSMAAAALTECLGGSVKQTLMAAEIAMEHHLGLTCDPIGGLVQIPCIERNTMGAVKAITASHLALESDAKDAKVTLDNVINTMWETARDMNSKYKETSEGGLATNIPVSLPEC
ncbi:MAG: L-serine ammonia-lyase [Balneolales bacterium]